MATSAPSTIQRVLSNNAVLVADPMPRVLVAKGIGFGKKPGDVMDPEPAAGSREYVELSEQHRAALEGLSSLDDATFQAISGAIEVAMDVLGGLHPSVYIILAEHISFALQRAGRGEIIRNTLLPEIKAVVPEEFTAAELVVNYVNSHTDGTPLPVDEAAYIALHLHAARTNSTVKHPLAVANAVGRVTARARRLLAVPGTAGEEELSLEITFAYRRLQRGRLRTNVVQRAVEKQLPREFDIATVLLTDLMARPELPEEALGEAAFLAVFLHGWEQDHGTRLRPGGL